MLNVVWFKRDLRVSDHAALTAALGRGLVLPIYIIEPEHWGQSTASALRLVMTVIKTTADLERIGDETKRVASMAITAAGAGRVTAG